MLTVGLGWDSDSSQAFATLLNQSFQVVANARRVRIARAAINDYPMAVAGSKAFRGRR